MHDHQSRIFVSIASYRDPECQHTVRDLFAKAKYPERIFVGICWQFDPELDKDCFTAPPPYPDQVRISPYHALESKGACWARSEALSLREGEDYVLQLDAHMRFVEDWDVRMIDTLARCPTQPAALSTMVPGYTPPDTLYPCEGLVPITFVRSIDYPEQLQPVSLFGLLRHPSQITTPGPLITPFFVGNFLFGHARMFDEVPFDPHIFFWGEETAYAARLWTHGYDLYQPDSVLIYHYWVSKSREKIAGESYKIKNERATTAKWRLWHLLELQKTDNPDSLINIERYSMGKVRPLADFWKFAGIDIPSKTIHPKAAKGRWEPYKG